MYTEDLKHARIRCTFEPEFYRDAARVNPNLQPSRSLRKSTIGDQSALPNLMVFHGD